MNNFNQISDERVMPRLQSCVEIVHNCPISFVLPLTPPLSS